MGLVLKMDRRQAAVKRGAPALPASEAARKLPRPRHRYPSETASVFMRTSMPHPPEENTRAPETEHVN